MNTRVFRFMAILISVPLAGALCANLAGSLCGCGRPHGAPPDTQTADAVTPAPAKPAPSMPAPQPASPVAQSRAPVSEPPAAAPASPQAKPAPAPAAGKFIAYYFHRTTRCPTCLKIERTAKDTVEKNFAADLKSGRLEWRAVNIEEPGNEHFEKDFELESSSLVLVEMKADQVARWQTEEEVWDLVGDTPRFHEYVHSQVRAFMAGGKAAP